MRYAHHSLSQSFMSPLSHVRDVMQDRSLLFTLVAYELKLKYRGTLLGFDCAKLNPLLMLTVVAFTYVFNKHYPLHLFALLGLTQQFPAKGTTWTQTGRRGNLGGPTENKDESHFLSSGPLPWEDADVYEGRIGATL